MGDALVDLEFVLRSKKEQLTLQEANILLNWRAQAMKDFTVGFGGGSIVTWLATQRVKNLYRVNLALSAAAVCGFWRFGRSVESSVEHILSLEGTRIQSELANIMLNKYRDDPWVLQRLSKHFYSEEVYDDTSVDRPKVRWRFRNFFGEPTHQQSASQSEDTDSKSQNVKKAALEPNQVNANAAGDAMENPFDLIFGFTGSADEVPHPDAPNASSRRQKRREKRSRRRHRRHHQEEEESDI